MTSGHPQASSILWPSHSSQPSKTVCSLPSPAISARSNSLPKLRLRSLQRPPEPTSNRTSLRRPSRRRHRHCSRCRARYVGSSDETRRRSVRSSTSCSSSKTRTRRRRLRAHAPNYPWVRSRPLLSAPAVRKTQVGWKTRRRTRQRRSSLILRPRRPPSSHLRALKSTTTISKRPVAVGP